MKKLLVKLFFAFLFLMPRICFADFIGCHTNHNFSFEFQNLNAFLTYNFYFSTWENGDTTIAENRKTFSITNNRERTPIFLFAKNKFNNNKTASIEIDGYADKTTLITIQKIENDSIYFKTDIIETQSSAFHSKPIDFLPKLLIFISFCGLFIYCCTLLTRKTLTQTK